MWNLRISDFGIFSNMISSFIEIFWAMQIQNFIIDNPLFNYLRNSYTFCSETIIHSWVIVTSTHKHYRNDNNDNVVQMQNSDLLSIRVLCYTFEYIWKVTNNVIANSMKISLLHSFLRLILIFVIIYVQATFIDCAALAARAILPGRLSFRGVTKAIKIS